MAIRKRKRRGFTLLEFLIVAGILAVILGITLIAINPVEQSSRASDTSAEITAMDFIHASVQHFAEVNMPPWQADPDCLTQLTAGGTLADMPDCIAVLTKGGNLDAEYRAKKRAGRNQSEQMWRFSSSVLCSEIEEDL